MSYQTVESEDIKLNIGRAYIETLYRMLRKQAYVEPCPEGNKECNLLHHLHLQPWPGGTMPAFFWDRDNEGLPVYAITPHYRGVRFKKTDNDTFPSDLVIGETYGSYCNFVRAPERFDTCSTGAPILIQDSEGMLDPLNIATGLTTRSLESVVQFTEVKAAQANIEFHDYLNNNPLGSYGPPLQGLFQTMPGSFSAVAGLGSPAQPHASVVQINQSSVSVLGNHPAGTLFMKPDGSLYTADNRGRLIQVAAGAPPKPPSITQQKKEKRGDKSNKNPLEYARKSREDAIKSNQEKARQAAKELHGQLTGPSADDLTDEQAMQKGVEIHEAQIKHEQKMNQQISDKARQADARHRSLWGRFTSG